MKKPSKKVLIIGAGVVGAGVIGFFVWRSIKSRQVEETATGDLIVQEQIRASGEDWGPRLVTQYTAEQRARIAQANWSFI